MARRFVIKKPLPPISRVSINSALASSPKTELIRFYHYANNDVPEVGLTEFAARVCYNSTDKMGTAPNFVRKVLQHGHLSVAEHASVGINFRALEKKAGGAQSINRFFFVSTTYIAANMRSWIEFLSVKDYFKFYDAFLSIFPPAFADGAVVHELNLDLPQQFSVPEIDNVALLAVNFGNMITLQNNGRDESNTWGRFTFLLDPISRACSHHIARHRGASISEQSQRYVDATKRPGFVVPPGLNELQRNVFEDAYAAMLQTYKNLRNSGVAKEDARFVLPMATHTRMVVSFDKNELLHFFSVRCASDAQWEIREVANRMLFLATLATGQKELVEMCAKFGVDKLFQNAP